MENKCIWVLWDYSLWAVVDSELAFGLLSVIMCPLYNDWKVLWDKLQIIKLEILGFPNCSLFVMVCVLWFCFVFSGQNVVQLHVGYSKYPKEQLQSFREDVILANHAHVSLLWPSAQNQTCTAMLLWWPLVKTEAAKSSLLSFKLATSGLINDNFVIMLLGNTCYAIGNPLSNISRPWLVSTRHYLFL